MKTDEYHKDLKGLSKASGKYDLRYCTECGRIFAYPGIGPDVCRQCLEKDRENFDKVKDYLETHDSSLPQTAIDTGVSTRKLYQWVREERLYFKSTEGSGLFCEICGAPIATGRYCRKCKAKLMLKGVKVDSDEPASRNIARMRFVGNDKDKKGIF